MRRWKKLQLCLALLLLAMRECELSCAKVAVSRSFVRRSLSFDFAAKWKYFKRSCFWVVWSQR